jgi:hypothetical protein
MVRRLLILLPTVLLGVAPGKPDAVPTDRAPSPAAPVATNRAALPTPAQMERLARTDPVAFLENCLRHYRFHVGQKPEIAAAAVGVSGQALGGSLWDMTATVLAGSFQVNGYTLTMQKQESINGRPRPREVIEVAYRERPHSVFMRWLEGAGRAERALYVEGENDGKLLARPKSALARRIVGDVYPVDVDGPDAAQAGRYSMKEFGLRQAAERTLAFAKADLARGEVRIEYQGVKNVKEAGNRPCHALHFIYSKPQRDDCTDAMVYIDTETWLQVGSVLRKADGGLVAAYYFRGIRLNPEFKPTQFQPAALK